MCEDISGYFLFCEMIIRLGCSNGRACNSGYFFVRQFVIIPQVEDRSLHGRKRQYPGFKYPQFDYRNRKQETADFLANYAKDRNKFAIKRYPRAMTRPISQPTKRPWSTTCPN